MRVVFPVLKTVPLTSKGHKTMTFMTRLMTVTAAAAVVIGMSAAAMAAPDAAKQLTADDVEKIVREFIMKNPEVILASVDDYQKNSQRVTQDAAVQKNKDALFSDTAAPILGNPNGDVTLVEFMDYNCHYCKVAFPTVNALIEKDKNLRVVIRDFPILGPTSDTAAKWALAAHKQKKYAAFHRAMLENKTPITDALLEKVARDIGMDLAQAKRDAQSADTLLQIERNRGLASNLGLSGTPAFVIDDGSVVFGAYTQEELEKMIAAARAKKKETAK